MSLILASILMGAIAPRAAKGSPLAILWGLGAVATTATALAVHEHEKLKPADYSAGLNEAATRLAKLINPEAEKVVVSFIPPALRATQAPRPYGRFTRYSTGVTAPPESGKTHFMNLLFRQIYSQNPNAYCRVLDIDNKKRGLNWCGAPVGRVVFDRSMLTQFPDVVQEFHSALDNVENGQEMHLFIPEIGSMLNALKGSAEQVLNQLADIAEQGNGKRIYLHLDMQDSAVGRVQLPESVKTSLHWIAINPTTNKHLKEISAAFDWDSAKKAEILALRQAGKRFAVSLTQSGIDVFEIPNEEIEPLDFPLESPVDVWLASLNWDELVDFSSPTAAWNLVKDSDDTPDGFVKSRRNGNVWWSSFKHKFASVNQEASDAGIS